ncbi:MAG: hypothetical protein ACFE75_12780 [Candidatus Hodarchaeota archaeon]
MKKRILLIGTILFVIFILISNIDSVVALDDDDDNVDDDFEALNLRDVEVLIDSNEVKMQSLLKSDTQVDEIELGIKYDNEGINIEVSYESEYRSENETEFEIEFEATFRKLIEFVDINKNGIFEPSIDVTISELDLNSFDPAIYVEEPITAQTSIHHITINTSDNIFSMHFYVSEEFFLKNDSLIIPTKPKIDIEINGFNFLNISSKLAIYLSLESSLTYEEHGETEDEELGYASDEDAVSISQNNFTGIFSWNENASVDGSTSLVNASALEADDYNPEDQKIYLIYPQGTQIVHDPKIGIEGILRLQSEQFSWYFLTIFLAIGAVTISLAVPIYYYFRKKRIPSIDEQIDRSLNVEELSESKNIELTSFSEEFYQIINQFDWDPNEKEEFIKEMASLTPKERKRIISEMLNKSQSKKD